MKIKKGFAKREIAGSNIVVPVGKASSDFNGMITLNGTGSFFWDCLCSETSIDEVVDKVCAEYEADRNTVKKDVEAFVAMLRENCLLEE